MAYGQWRKTYAKTAGRLIVSGGTFPAEKIVAHQDLPTLDGYLGMYHPDDPRLETVIRQGTVLQVVEHDDGPRFVPANGTIEPVTITGGDSEVTVPEDRAPVGIAQYHLYRPMFADFDNHGGGFVCGSALLEYPMIEGGKFDGAAPGDWVTYDGAGRPEVGNDADWQKVIGRVLAAEEFSGDGAREFDSGLLEYMIFPNDAPVVRDVYTITEDDDYAGTVARSNLDVPDVKGAVRVLINL